MMLHLEEDGSPSLIKKPEKYYGPVYDGGMVPAWRTWQVNRFSSIIAFSTDGKRLFTGGMNHTLEVWDTASHSLEATLYVAPPAKPGDTPTDWVAFTPAGHFAASEGGEKLLRIREAIALPWLGAFPTGKPLPASDMPKLRDPAKLKEALGVK